jgi:hypothetical protein
MLDIGLLELVVMLERAARVEEQLRRRQGR